MTNQTRVPFQWLQKTVEYVSHGFFSPVARHCIKVLFHSIFVLIFTGPLLQHRSTLHISSCANFAFCSHFFCRKLFWLGKKLQFWLSSISLLPTSSSIHLHPYLWLLVPNGSMQMHVNSASIPSRVERKMQMHICCGRFRLSENKQHQCSARVK